MYAVDSAIQLLDNRGLNCKMESKVKIEKLLWTFAKLSGLTYQLKFQLNYT